MSLALVVEAAPESGEECLDEAVEAVEDDTGDSLAVVLRPMALSSCLFSLPTSSEVEAGSASASISRRRQGSVFSRSGPLLLDLGVDADVILKGD